MDDPWRWRFWALLAIVVGVPVLVGVMLAMRFLPDRPVTYANVEDHFKYGSTGGERNAGFPLWIWKALPVVFADKLPPNGGTGFEAFGMIYENDEHGRRRELPVGDCLQYFAHSKGAKNGQNGRKSASYSPSETINWWRPQLVVGRWATEGEVSESGPVTVRPNERA